MDKFVQWTELTVRRTHRNSKDAKLAGQQRTGRFPNLQKIRTGAGLEISDLVNLLGGSTPKERSIRRLDGGGSIRLTSVYRVFNTLNEKLGNTLARDEVVED